MAGMGLSIGGFLTGKEENLNRKSTFVMSLIMAVLGCGMGCQPSSSWQENC
jgi:hypothetical protein